MKDEMPPQRVDAAPYYITFVVEYPSANDIAPVGIDKPIHGGKLVAVQFDDALKRLDAILEANP